jgi:predicted ABC-type ATPase
MDSNSQHHLSPADHEHRYLTRIQPRYLNSVVPADTPRAIILGGQSGAGKSVIAEAAVKELGGRTAVVRIDTDALRTFHPNYEDLAKSGKNASNATQYDAQRWRDRLELEAINSRRNLVIDTTLGWPESAAETAKRLQQAGYLVEARVISAHSTESQLGTVARYYEQVLHKGAGRWVNREYHNSVYDRVPKSLEAFEQNKLVAAIHIINREGDAVHSQKLDISNSWSTEKMASQALRDDREARANDPAIVSRHFKGWDALEQTLDTLQVSGKDREELAALRRAHELELLGKVQKRGEKAEAFLTEKPVDALRRFPNDENLKNAFMVLNEAVKFSKTMENHALQKLVLQEVRQRLANSLDTGKAVAKVATRDYDQLTRKIESEGPTTKDKGPER